MRHTSRGRVTRTSSHGVCARCTEVDPDPVEQEETIEAHLEHRDPEVEVFRSESVERGLRPLHPWAGPHGIGLGGVVLVRREDGTFMPVRQP